MHKKPNQALPKPNQVEKRSCIIVKLLLKKSRGNMGGLKRDSSSSHFGWGRDETAAVLKHLCQKNTLKINR